MIPDYSEAADEYTETLDETLAEDASLPREAGE